MKTPLASPADAGAPPPDQGGAVSILDSPADIADVRAQLEEVYAQVPATRCESSGECCALTPKEMASGYATMFPLYQVEYVNIVDHVRSHFPRDHQQELFGFRVERPQQCPFLSEDHHCTIYPARPLICRTYAVMKPETIAAAAQQYRQEAPAAWIQQFVRRESGMFCPRVVVSEPEKVPRHAHNLITQAYERSLTDASRRLKLVAGERREVARKVVRRRHWPVRWTWGGYNAVALAPMAWLHAHLKDYWAHAILADAG